MHSMPFATFHHKSCNIYHFDKRVNVLTIFNFAYLASNDQYNIYSRVAVMGVAFLSRLVQQFNLLYRRPAKLMGNGS